MNNGLIATLFLGGLAAFIIAIGTCAMKQTNEFQELCRAKGGVVISEGQGHNCWTREGYIDVYAREHQPN